MQANSGRRYLKKLTDGIFAEVMADTPENDLLLVQITFKMVNFQQF